MNKTKIGRKLVLDHFLRRIDSPFAAGVWLALHSGDPTDAGLTTNELSGGGYIRMEISTLMGDADLATGVSANALAIEFPDPTVDWDEVTHASTMTASTGGDMIYFGPCATSRLATPGDPFIIDPGQLTIEEQ